MLILSLWLRPEETADLSRNGLVLAEISSCLSMLVIAGDCDIDTAVSHMAGNSCKVFKSTPQERQLQFDMTTMTMVFGVYVRLSSPLSMLKSGDRIVYTSAKAFTLCRCARAG